MDNSTFKKLEKLPLWCSQDDFYKILGILPDKFIKFCKDHKISCIRKKYTKRLLSINKYEVIRIKYPDYSKFIKAHGES